MNVSLIVSFDTIKDEATLRHNSSILKLITSISEKMGEVNANYLHPISTNA